MKGAIIGDIAGSIYEHHNIKTKEFPLFQASCHFTDDTVMTVAVAMGLHRSLTEGEDLLDALTDSLHEFGNHYPHAGYGRRFRHWLRSADPQPYNSLGNGAPMRCSPAAYVAATPEQAYELGTWTAAPTHNHPEGMKAAGVTCLLIWHALHGMRLDQLRELALRYYEVPKLDELRPVYGFDVSCEGTMPAVFAAFFESTGFEDAIRNAVSLGGDCDTVTAITGSLAEAYYGVPEEIWQKARRFLTPELDECTRLFTAFVREQQPR